MNCYVSQSSRDRAFTLIELLVVISIMTLLIAILLPALGEARFAAQRAVCMANQRQIHIPLFTYAHDNSGAFPDHGYFLPDVVYANGYSRVFDGVSVTEDIWASLHGGRYLYDGGVTICPITTDMGFIFSNKTANDGYSAAWNYDREGGPPTVIGGTYAWYANFATDPDQFTFLDDEPIWPEGIDTVRSDNVMLAHRSFNLVSGPTFWYDFSHRGGTWGGDPAAGLRSVENTVLYGDGHVKVHTGDDYKPRAESIKWSAGRRVVYWY